MESEDTPEFVQIDSEYELMAYSSTKIDYEYIINLIQNIVTPDDGEENISPDERRRKIDEIRQYVEELGETLDKEIRTLTGN